MPGTIIFKPIEANLNLGKDLLSKADPYCQFTINGQQIKSQVCKSGGKHPVWDDSITVPASNQPTCFVELKDKDLLKDDKLGSFEIDLREIESQGRLKKWYPIFHKDKPAGEILMEAVFAPQGGLTTGLVQGTGLTQGTAIPVQTIPVQSHTIQQTYGMPVNTTSTLIGAPIGGATIIEAPRQQVREISVTETPFQVPNTTQTVHTKETVILPGVQQQQHVQVPIMSQQMPMMNMTDTALLNPSMTESLSEYYAREALCRGVDPLGTHVYTGHAVPLGGIPLTQSVGYHGGLPSQNLPQQQLIGQTGLRSQFPGQPALVQSQIPGQATQHLPGQIQPNQY